jgi:hypothetical protein
MSDTPITACIIVLTPSEHPLGMTFVGPFNSEAEARTWHDEVWPSSEYAAMEAWFVAPLEPPR